MYDTIAIAGSLLSVPNIELMVENGCKPFFRNGEVYKLALNGKPNSKEPRLTITRSRDDYWRLQAEVSIGAWLYGSNLILPNETALQHFFDDLTNYILFKTGAHFDVRDKRVVVLDITRDFQLAESQVPVVLKSLGGIEIPKYDRIAYNNSSVYFVNKGKIKNKFYKFYSKEADCIDKGSTKEETERAKGKLRLEIHHGDNRAVSNLRKSLKLTYHNAARIITPETSEWVINSAMKLFNVEALLNTTQRSNLDILELHHKQPMLQKLINHLLLKEKFGLEYYKLSPIKITAAMVRRYDRECAKIGISSL